MELEGHEEDAPCATEGCSRDGITLCIYCRTAQCSEHNAGGSCCERASADQIAPPPYAQSEGQDLKVDLPPPPYEPSADSPNRHSGAPSGRRHRFIQVMSANGGHQIRVAGQGNERVYMAGNLPQSCVQVQSSAGYQYQQAGGQPRQNQAGFCQVQYGSHMPRQSSFFQAQRDFGANMHALGQQMQAMGQQFQAQTQAQSDAFESRMQRMSAQIEQQAQARAARLDRQAREHQFGMRHHSENMRTQSQAYAAQVRQQADEHRTHMRQHAQNMRAQRRAFKMQTQGFF